MLLFSPGLLVAVGATVLIAVLDKTAEEYGFQWLGTFLKLLLPILAFAAGVYFIETNPLLKWLGL